MAAPRSRWIACSPARKTAPSRSIDFGSKMSVEINFEAQH